MTTTSTLKQIIDQLADETGIGYILTGLTGTTTTLTDATGNQASSALTGVTIPVGSWILITDGGAPGDVTRVSNYVPSTGVITVDPPITTAATDAILVTPDYGLDKVTRLKDAVNRALLNRIMRPQMTPLTFVPDGDLLGTTVTDYWTGSAATPTYVTPTFPAGGAAASFFTGAQRVLQSVTSNATNYVKSNVIDLALNATVNAYQWYFQTAIRVASGTGNAQIKAWDETNNAAIPANIITGDASFTHVTSSTGFMNMSGTLNIPATCKAISFRLISDSTTTTIQMTPLVAYPVDAVSFPLPNRILTDDYVGNFHYGRPITGASGPYNVIFSDPITVGGLTHHLTNFGDHRIVTFNFRPMLPIYYEEYIGEAALTAMTDTTTLPLDQVVKWAKFELYKQLYQHEKVEYRSSVYGTMIPVPSKWKTKAIEAKREANYSEYEPTTISVSGRV